VKLRALAMVVIAVALTVFTSSQTFAATTVPLTAKALPSVDLSATPAGWIPVAFGNAQISVPAAWWVLYNSSPCPTGSPPGEVFVNPLIRQSTPWRFPLSDGDRSRSEHDGQVRTANVSTQHRPRSPRGHQRHLRVPLPHGTAEQLPGSIAER
jgi:hypothetical protein